MTKEQRHKLVAELQDFAEHLAQCGNYTAQGVALELVKDIEKEDPTATSLADCLIKDGAPLCVIAGYLIGSFNTLYAEALTKGGTNGHTVN